MYARLAHTHNHTPHHSCRGDEQHCGGGGRRSISRRAEPMELRRAEFRFLDFRRQLQIPIGGWLTGGCGRTDVLDSWWWRVDLASEQRWAALSPVNRFSASFSLELCISSLVIGLMRWITTLIALVSVGASLFLFQLLAGINAVVYHTTSVFRSAGITSDVAASALVGAANVFGKTFMNLRQCYCVVLIKIRRLAELMMHPFNHSSQH